MKITLYSIAVLLGVSTASLAQKPPDPQTRFRPPSAPPTIGVQVRVTETGVVVVGFLSPRSTASRVGIERGDTIINVDGQQVGRVENRVVDLDEAIDRALSRERRATLLVRNGRNGELLNIVVRRDQMGNPGPFPPGRPGGGMAGPMGQVKKWYLQFLSRDLTRQEMENWEAHLRQGKPVEQIQDLILSSGEYYTLCGGDDVKFIGGLFRDVLRRQPVSPEGANWLARLKQVRGDRLKLAEAFRATYQLPFP